ncbi:3-hydroxyacyl-CoA dehydrogenase family protein [Aridibaculum aurantiacum]|uniref:3-hydroxyacyl-CoA dehydrogenase family protein n=1 Tax=Aridibaculum aurantiacum TaxID=2810307 RepID=UPI001A96A633|nr:3-hydroxyacyl-CoA dehydrogenase NAD-binding domain-containing protein [Aridibaculum aurantiacum]
MATTICICGAGTMGSGIAQVAAQKGFTTILFDVSNEMVQKARLALETTLTALETKGKIAEGDKDSIIGRITFTSNVDDCKADVIIEAIVEKLEAKVDLFNKLSSINSPATIYATNTSSLPIGEIAAAVPERSHVAGLHFFNPAPLMKLVEVVAGKDTSPQVVEQLVELAKQLDKTPVVCKDAPGFIVNRVARHYYLEAMKLVELGVADHETIDKVLEAAGFKMGPFKLMDMIGMDINYGVSNIVWNALGKPARLTPSPLQKAKVNNGELGRKTGKGFYNYEKQ